VWRRRFSQRRKHARARGFLRPVGATEILAAPKARPRPAIPRGCNELYFYRMPVRGPRPTAWAATQGRPYDAATARLRAAAPRGSGDDAMKITFTGFCGAGDDPMNITFTSFLPARAPVRRSLRPVGADVLNHELSTGCATPKAASLHPWLHPSAPLGRKRQLSVTAFWYFFAFRFPVPGSRGCLLPGARPARRTIPRHAAGLFQSSRSRFPPLRREAPSQPSPPDNLRNLRMGLRPRRPQHIVHPIISVCTFNHTKEGRL